MYNYIYADYRRILTRRPRIIYIALYEAVLFIIMLFSWRRGGDFFNGEMLLSSLGTWVFTFGSLLLGLCTIINVYTDDFESKTIQVAIGTGIKRIQVVISKLIQVALLLLTDILLTAVIIGVAALIFGVHFEAVHIGKIVVEFLMILLENICWISIISILIFKFHGMKLPMAVFAICSLGVFNMIVTLLVEFGPKILKTLHLDYIFPDYFLDSFSNSLLNGGFSVVGFLGIIIYTALGVWLTYWVFRNQELDF